MRIWLRVPIPQEHILKDIRRVAAADVSIDAWGSPSAVLIFALAVSGAAITATLSSGIREMGPLHDKQAKEVSAA